MQSIETDSMTSRRARCGRLIPGPADLVFAIVLVLVLIGGRYGLFNDPGTPWHLRLGREILATGTVPRYDTLTFTHARRTPWVDQSWGFDVLLAAVVDAWGWSAAVALTALGLAALYAAMARGLIRDGISPVVAVVVAILAAAIGSIHFLIRPHLFTFALRLPDAPGLPAAARARGLGRLPGPDLHGDPGEPARRLRGPAGDRGHGRGSAMPSPGRWDAPRRRNLLKFAAAAGALVPGGPGEPLRHRALPATSANLLVSSGVTSLIVEYQPAPFGKPEAEVLEWVLLALVGLPVVSSRRIDRYQLAHVLVWLHLALTSIRNAPLFALAAAPALATLLDGLPLSMRTIVEAGRPRRRSGRRRRRSPCWCVVACGVWLGGFDPEKWPLRRWRRSTVSRRRRGSSTSRTGAA